MHTKMIIVAIAACAIALPTLASAQQTDSKGNAMGSDKVGNGTPRTSTPGMSSGTTGSSTTGSSMSGTSHSTSSSSQGDVGPGGNKNGAPSPKQ